MPGLAGPAGALAAAGAAAGVLGFFCAIAPVIPRATNNKLRAK